MTPFDGTAARQLHLLDDEAELEVTTGPARHEPVRRNLKLLKEDVYAQILRRRRRAQIAARHSIDRAS